MTFEDLGVKQKGDPALEIVCRPVNWPAEQEKAREIIAHMSNVMETVRARHPSKRGLGLAAPQLGYDSRVCAVRMPGGQTRWMINPEITDSASETVKNWEGCLSFTDVRGLVPRPVWIELSYMDEEGRTCAARLEHQEARMACHKIDHLDGILCDRRMDPGDKLIPIGELKSGRYPSYTA